MRKEDQVSEEQLNAFIDGELEAEEESRIFTATEECSDLDGRLCQQRKLKELVQHAYRDVPRVRRRDGGAGPRRRFFGLAAAAVLALAVGLVAGHFATRTLDQGPGPETQSAHAVAPEAEQDWLLHVTSADPARMRAALERADQLMREPGTAPDRRIEIVANEGGLALLRSDVTPFGDRIRELAAQDVLFFACSRAIERLEEQGVEVRLVPEANARHSALDRVVLRLQDGWSYQKI